MIVIPDMLKDMNKMIMSAILLLWGMSQSFACTDFIVGKRASADGSVMCTYNADSYGAYHVLYHSPAGKHAKGEMIKIYDGDTNEYHGEIPQVEETYNVIGYINEYQVTIHETTYGGREEMVDTTGILDYVSLMQIALQRSKTAREAIKVMTNLAETYGYCSEGESFSICDPNEAWYMEMQGAGVGGVVWVAVRIPDDAICAHANQSRITTFNQKDKENVMYSKNCIKYARKMGWFTGKDADFSWNAAYAAPDFSGRRFCDARVWAFYRFFSDDMDKYLPWAEGKDKDAKPLPLWIVPNRKLTVQDLIMANRDHYEGTPLEVKSTIGGGIWEMPYQPTPLTYEVDGKKYFTERPISTQQTAMTYITQMRSWLPREIGGCLWVANDDPNMVAYTPVYCCATKSPECYDAPGADDVTYSDRSAFWVCNWVSNMVYPRYSVLFPELQSVRDRLEKKYFSQQREIEDKAKSLYASSPSEAVRYLNEYSCREAQQMLDEWKKLATLLIVRYNDMAVKKMKDGKYLKTKDGLIVPVERPGYPKEYARRMHSLSPKNMEMPQ